MNLRATLVLGSVIALGCGGSALPSIPPAPPEPPGASPFRTPPAPAAAPAPTPTAAAPAAPADSKPAYRALKEDLTGVASLHLSSGSPAAGAAKATGADVKVAKDVEAIVAAIGVEQTPTDALPKCLPQARIDMLDKQGKKLGSVSLFCGDALAPEARFDPATGRAGAVVLKDPKALQAAFKKAGAPIAVK